MLKIWTEEFLSVSTPLSVAFYAARFDAASRRAGERAACFYKRIAFSDHIEAGSEIYSAALPGSRWKELRAEYEACGGLC